MKKLITILVTIFALCALTVTTFADQDTASAEKDKAVQISAELSEENALAAALNDAGKNETDVTVSKNKLSEKKTQSGESVAVYTVKFNTEDTTYKYFVDANTGEILYKSMEYQNPKAVFKSSSDKEKKNDAENTKDASESGSHKKEKTNSKKENSGKSDSSEEETISGSPEVQADPAA